MSDLRKAAERTLRWLDSETPTTVDAAYAEERAIADALRAALAQQAEPVQEPVAWMWKERVNGDFDSAWRVTRCEPPPYAIEQQPLYTAPTPRKPETEQEPVAWMVYTEGGTSAYVTDNPNDLVGAYRALAIYTAPPQRPRLTDEEIEDIYLAWDVTPGRRIADLARAIERKVRGE